MTPKIIALGIAFLAVQFITADAQAAGGRKSVVRLDTRPGVTMDVVIIEAKNPIANVILLEGGGGELRLSGTKVGSRGFLVTAHEKFAAHGLTALLVDAPSDRKGKTGKNRMSGMSGRFRTGREHVRDIDVAASWLKRKNDLPVWLVGISRGSQSATHLAINGGKTYGGLVLISSMVTVPDSSPAVSSMRLDRIKVPTFIIAHSRDRCTHTPPEGAETIRSNLKNAVKTEVRHFKGGKSAGRDPCKPLSYHTFYRMESDVVEAVAGFIKANPGAPTDSGEFLSENAVRESLVGNTIRFESARGGIVFAYFDADGGAAVAAERSPGRIIRKKWWIKNNGLFCRTVGRDNHDHCSKIATGDAADVLKFHSPNGNLRYQVDVLTGSQLPE